PSSATEVTLTDPLPVGAAFVSVTGTGCSQSSGNVTCNIGSLGNGNSATVTIVDGATTPGAIANTATVTANEADLTPTNNSATANTTVDPSADAGVTKTGAGTAAMGQNVTYTIVVTNHGPQSATGATLTDALPTGATCVSATG